MTTSSSSRSKTIRPFTHASLYEGVLAVEVTHSNWELPYEGANRQEKADFEDGIISVTVSFDSQRLIEALEESGLSRSDMSLAVLASGRVLKTTEVFHLQEVTTDLITEGFYRVFEVSSHPETFGDSFKGFDLTVALILNESRAGGALDFKHMGTWLDRHSFAVVPSSAGVGLDPRPMDSEIKTKLGIQQSSFLHLEFEGSLLPVAEPGALNVWVDADYYSRLFVARKSAEGKAAQRLLQRAVISSIVYQVVSELRGQEADALEDLIQESEAAEISVFRGLLNEFNKGPFTNVKATEFAQVLLSNPELVITRVEPQGLLAALKKGLAGDE